MILEPTEIIENKMLQISYEEIEKIVEYCIRKMDLAGIQNKEEYLPILLENEIENYLLRMTINATTMVRMLGKEMVVNVQSMSCNSMSSKMS